MKRFVFLMAAVLTLALCVSAHAPGETATPEPGNAIVTITLQVDGRGNVTGWTVDPSVATIRGASKDGMADGGSITWRVTANRRVQATVTIDFGKDSPFASNFYQLRGGVIGPGLDNEMTSGPALVESGRFGYKITVEQ